MSLFRSSASNRHQPPSSLANGWFLTLLVLQLVAVSFALAIAHRVYSGFRDISNRGEQLRKVFQQIDAVSRPLNSLPQAVPLTAEERRQFDLLSAEAERASAQLVVTTATEFPGETAAVRQAVASLKSALEALRQDGNGAAKLRDEAALAVEVVNLEHVLDKLRSSVNALSAANSSRLTSLQRVRLWGAVWQAIAFLITLVALGYVTRLYRHMRREVAARYSVESELRVERAALEERVQARTAALEGEVRERQRAEGLNRGRNHILEMVARNEPVGDIFKVLTRMVTEFRRSSVCTVHSLDAGTLKLISSSGLSDALVEHLGSVCADFSGAPESVALRSRNPHMVEDLGEEHKPWSELLRANGLISVWSAPFFASGAEALGTLTVYTRLKWKPTPDDTETLEMACHMASLVLERSHLQAQLIDHAYHDSLTGSPNRRLGQDRLANAIMRSFRTVSRFAVLWIDLDSFKHINDRYGHPAGDEVLRQAARRLTGRLRASDTLARMGGDEFMVILEGTSTHEQAEELARELLAILSHPMQIGELALVAKASIGIALYPEDGKTANILAQHADQAMYAAKFGSAGFCSYSPEMDREPAERRELEAELSHALQTGGFTIAYQPVCLPDGSLQGFEALLRFNSPRLGEVSPAQFIPLAEQAQLIVPLGEWALREVCRQSGAWREAGHKPICVAVNISALQFAREDFADTVARILSETGQSGGSLVLELTESIVMRDFAESARQMKRLKHLGVRIAVDDFGTGYSSLSYLHRLPIDVLKIDRSFMENLTEPDGTGPIVQAVVSMAHTLGLRVVAEGVETAEQLYALDDCGCDLIQGYFFSRPVDAAMAAEFQARGRVEGGANRILPAPTTVSEKKPVRLLCDSAVFS
jgi:diguanylate cyclase (GGDEF)-like protein